MKRIKLYINIFIITSLFISCDSSKIYHEVETFKEHKWNKSKKIVFEPEIIEADKYYKFTFNIRYFSGFPHLFLKLNVNITNPNGVIYSDKIKIQTRTKDYKYIGDGMGDYWDLDYVFIEKQQIKKTGKYKIEVTHNLNNEHVILIEELGLTINKLD